MDIINIIKEEINKNDLDKKTTSFQYELENKYGVDLFIKWSVKPAHRNVGGWFTKDPFLIHEV